jgi:hypothetical protein
MYFYPALAGYRRSLGMQLTMQISRDDQGQYRALCPELGVSTLDTDRKGAVDKLKTLIFDWLLAQSQAINEESDAGTASDDFDECLGEFAVLNGDDSLKLVRLPRRASVN